METKITKADKIKGGIIGLLVGDALGVPYEFHPKQEIPSFEEIEFEPPDWFRRAHAGVSSGTYSDDGAQALILLNSLLVCGKFDAANFANGLINWYDNGFMAVGNRVFDVGIQTAKAIRELKRGTEPLLAGGIAGLRFGINGIPERWRENLRGREIYETLLEKLLAGV